MEQISDEELKVIIEHDDWYDEDYQKLATELLQLRADALVSQNHNSAVSDRIYKQLQDAGYHGTLSEMVDAVLNPWIPVETGALPVEGQDIYVLELADKVISHWYFTHSLLPAFAKFDYWIPAEILLPQPPEVTK